MGPVTTNPWLISIINMTIVFGVLAALGVLMKIRLKVSVSGL